METQDVPSGQNSTARFVGRTRKRARKACLSCRARKVRCDVSMRGRPCMNCYLDNEACVVTGRASKYRAAQYDFRDGIQASLPPYLPLEEQLPSGSEEAAVEPNIFREDLPAASLDRLLESRPESTNFDIQAQNPTPAQNNLNDDSHYNLSGFHDLPPNSANIEEASPVDLRMETLADYLLNCHSTPRGNQVACNAHPASAPDIVYCHYPFLAITNITRLPHQDVNFLELQGCFRVPIRQFLDNLVQQYFLHVHSFLPLINEGDFWDLYYYDPGTAPRNSISLLLFQAMLFASCTFASESTIRGLGFSDIRAMRATFLRRAKLLHDLGTELSPLAISQAALLLSFTSLSSTKTPNTLWLTLAIENAKLAEAHLYSTMTTPSLRQQQSILKRVWWCCIIRDRSMGLLMRRPIQITKSHFDFRAHPLTADDFADEYERSKVYNPATKKKLAEIVARSIQLCITLTDILLLVFPLDGIHGESEERDRGLSADLDTCRVALRQWYAHTTKKLQEPQRNFLSTSPSISGKITDHESTFLYTNFMFMYYHTSRIVLCHYQVLHLDFLQAGSSRSGPLTKELSIIFENRHELQDATAGVTECHKDLVRRGLARWLPISAIGCTALPLVLNILDIQLCPPTNDGSRTGSALQQQLNILIEVMKAYWPQYDGVDWVSEIVRHIVTLAQLDNPKGQGRNSRITWTDIFAFQPSSYLRLTLALDLSLSKGRLPQDRDFPSSLRGLFTDKANPLRELIEGNCVNVKDIYIQDRATSRQETGIDQPLDFGPAVSDEHGSFTVDLGLLAHSNDPSFLQSQAGEADLEEFLPMREGAECGLADNGISDNSLGCLQPPEPDDANELDKSGEETARTLLNAITDGSFGECIYVS